MFLKVNSHVMVEKLLKLLVDKVDGNLLEAVVFKDLEPSDVEDSDKVALFEPGVIPHDSCSHLKELLTYVASISVSLHLMILGEEISRLGKKLALNFL